VVRNPYTGTDPNTTDQQARRNILSQYSNRWGTALSADDRQKWYDLAKHMAFPDRFGDMKGISGYNLYLKRNFQRKPDYAGHLDIPTEGGEDFWTEFLIATWQPTFTRVLLQFYQIRTGSNHEGCQYWRAGPYDSEARNPTAGEWLKIDYQVPCANVHDNGVVSGKWYWYKGRATWNSGIVSTWWYWQEPTF